MLSHRAKELVLAAVALGGAVLLYRKFKTGIPALSGTPLAPPSPAPASGDSGSSTDGGLPSSGSGQGDQTITTLDPSDAGLNATATDTSGSTTSDAGNALDDALYALSNLASPL